MKSPLFQSLLKGDLAMRDYFITSDTKPEIEKYDGNFIQYKTSSGNFYTRELLFNTVESEHWHSYDIPLIDPNTKTVIPKKYKTIWVYSTFYRHQIDLNLQNPKVLSMWFDFIGFWSSMGISRF
jgi:glycosidase